MTDNIIPFNKLSKSAQYSFTSLHPELLEKKSITQDKKEKNDKPSYNFKVYSAQDYYKDEEKEKPIIEKIIPEKSVDLFFGESGSLKSIFALGLLSSVSTGKKFLGFKTYKCPCLYLSTENPLNVDIKRIRAVWKGLGILGKRRRWDNLQFISSSRKGISTLSDEKYYNYLKATIQKYKIKLLCIDTLSPLIMDTDDNSAMQIVSIFNNKLFPLVDEFGLSILIIHHAQKSGKDFLGSIKIKASCDAFFEIKRENNNISMLCHKSRDAQELNLDAKVNFENKKDKLNKISFELLKTYYGKQSPTDKGNNPLERERAETLILENLKLKEYSYSELLSLCLSNGISKITSKRAINSLYEAMKIKKIRGKDKGYSLR